VSDDDGDRRLRVFGLELDSEFDIPGLEPVAPTGRDLPHTRLSLTDLKAMDAAWPKSEVRRISEDVVDEGPEPDRTIDAHPTAGYRLFARYFGASVVVPDGSLVRCAPPPIASWRWQRFLVGRVIPLAAVLRGHEVFHASGAVVDDAVIAIVGPTGAGKTSLALQLALQGSAFFTDDVLVLEPDGDGLVAHPGIGVANVRLAEEERVGERFEQEFGTPIGRSGRQKTHYSIPREDRSLPLRAMFFLVPGDAAEAKIRPLPAPEPDRLFASTFIYEIRPPERLVRLLDVSSRLARDVPMYEVHMGRAEPPDALARRIAEQTRS
jgi:hypothetical protein